jgi:uncharacterized protein YciW
MDIETARLLASHTNASEIARQIETFARLIAEEPDADERASMADAVCTLKEAQRLQEG